VTAFVLVPGAGGQAWYWHLVIAELARAGYQARPVDLPGTDPAAGLETYRDAIVASAAALEQPVTVVAQSIAGFSAPLACGRVPVERLVLVNAMIPLPGETAGEWWDHVGWEAAAQAAAEQDGRPSVDVHDLDTLFFHDLPAELVEVMRADPDSATEGPTVFAEPWPLTAWPSVPTWVFASRDDRLFPLSLQRHIASLRLGLAVEELPGGHLVALGHPHVLADQLIRASHAEPASTDTDKPH